MAPENALTITLDPADDAAVLESVAFLAPRLRMLVEGEAETLELRVVRTGEKQARFTLSRAGDILTERLSEEREGGFESVALWLAMKSAWSRAQQSRVPAAPSVVLEAPPPVQERPPTDSRGRVTVAARGFFQGEGLSAYGASIGIGRGDAAFSVLGDFGYVRSPVDDTLTVHHLFAEGHASYALVDGIAIEGTARLTAIVADSGNDNVGAFDAGFGGGAQIWLNTRPRAWIRTTVLGHPVQQRYLLDSGERESSPVTLTVSAGIAL